MGENVTTQYLRPPPLQKKMRENRLTKNADASESVNNLLLIAVKIVVNKIGISGLISW